MTNKKNICKERVSKLHGNLIVAYEEGDCLGNVGEIYFDKRTCRIKGISLASKFLEAEEKNYLKFSDIHKLGNSVVIVSSGGALSKTPKGLISSSLRVMNGIRIVTEEGEHLGEMADVNVTAETGEIRDILIYGDKRIPIDVEKDKIRIGPDMIVVPAAYKATIVANPPRESEDDFGHVVKSAGDVTRKLADSLSAAVHKLMDLTKVDDEDEAGKDKQDARPKSEATKKETASKETASAAKSTVTKKGTTAKKAASGTKSAPSKKRTAAKKKAADKKEQTATETEDTPGK
ncbi:MAG: hypothetical protein GVY36_01630 [Verrucomicrobia bacterium]|jgi:uncharacterized protein YrrD|nr:hypothetical protein [Verrucomicrobiota bacterium]